MEDSLNSFLTERFLPDAKLGGQVESFVLERIIRLLIFVYQTFSCIAGGTNEEESQHFWDQIHKHCSL